MYIKDLKDRLNLKLANGIKKVYPRYGLRDDDIIFASYPKSGNTWVRFIWLNMVSLLELNGREINFHNINGELSAEYDSHSYGETNYGSLPRIVKTHKEYNETFKKNRTIYLWRNPGDVMVSYYEYVKARTTYNNEFMDLSKFIRSDRYGIRKWCLHAKSWEKKANFILSYNNLQENTTGFIFELCESFGLGVKKEIVKKAVKRSTFKKMRRIENEKGRPSLANNEFKKNYKFTRKGKTGEWRQKISREDKTLIRKTLDKYSLDKYIN